MPRTPSCSCRACGAGARPPTRSSRALPGDDLIPDPLYATTRAITVQAPAEDVFPWLVQLGQNRGGFYTYDALENLFRLDIHSADRIHPEWQDLEPGSDYVSLDPEDTMKLTVVPLDPPRASSSAPAAQARPRRRPATSSRARSRPRGRSWWSRYRDLVAAPHPLARELAETVPAAFARAFLLEPAHFVMEEGMLRGVRVRAERPPAAPDRRPAPAHHRPAFAASPPRCTLGSLPVRAGPDRP